MKSGKKGKVKVAQIEKEEVKVSFFTDDVTISVNIPETLQKYTCNYYVRIAKSYKVNIQKIIFLYPSHKQLEFEILKILFTMASKENYICLTKYV